MTFAEHQLDPAQAALFERDQEFTPGILALTVPDLDADKLTAAVSIDPHSDDDGLEQSCRAVPRRPWR